MTKKSSANKPIDATYILTADYINAGMVKGGKKSQQFLFKRFTDFIVSLFILLAFFPLLLLIAVFICIDSPGPAIYRQRRVGRQGNFFQIYKFRTMHMGTPDLPTSEMQLHPTPVTKFGMFLRKTSLDELPQLLNIIKGEMSLVGPRPALYNQKELTAERLQVGVLEFPPGITGWAQVNGRDELSDSVKVELDKWYVEHWHYLLDWQIIFATFKAVFTGRGAI
jgi:O-antigen biosynthesis protein WbqP